MVIDQVTHLSAHLLPRRTDAVLIATHRRVRNDSDLDLWPYVAECITTVLKQKDIRVYLLAFGMLHHSVNDHIVRQSPFSGQSLRTQLTHMSITIRDTYGACMYQSPTRRRSGHVLRPCAAAAATAAAATEHHEAAALAAARDTLGPWVPARRQPISSTSLKHAHEV
jgi:hypothetical protein